MPKDQVFELTRSDVYAGVLDPSSEKPGVYIGGSYYNESTQIHVSWEDAMDLAKWIYRLRREWKPTTRKRVKD